MVLSILRPDASLPEFLAHRARSASFRRLAVNLMVGTVGASAALWWRPTAWLMLASVGFCFFAYGAWGMVDRARSRATPATNRIVVGVLEIFCALFAAIGALAIAALLFGVWAAALGTWIS